ncbi:MAG: 3-keto-disaccharide hydrolase [Planctomycetota bacterium]
MQHKPLLLFIGLITSAMPYTVSADEANALSKTEKQAGFELLFNGSTLDGWNQNKDKPNWVVKDGAITRTGRGGSLTYGVKKVPDDFELRFEWKVAKGSNSGVYYRPGQYEYQILDNGVHRDGQNPRTSAASLYFCMAPSHDATAPVGAWNRGRIVCKDSVIQHWLNGQKVIDFDYSDPKWEFNVTMLKQRGADLKARGGSLFLQDHGDPVWYRSIRMRTIPADEEIEHTDVKPATIPADVLEAERQKLEGIEVGRKEHGSFTVAIICLRSFIRRLQRVSAFTFEDILVLSP